MRLPHAERIVTLGSVSKGASKGGQKRKKGKKGCGAGRPTTREAPPAALYARKYSSAGSWVPGD